MASPLAASRLPVGSSARRIAGRGAAARAEGHALLLAARHLAGVVAGAGGEADGFELGLGAREGVGVAGELQGGGDVLQRGHGGDEVEGLEHHSHMIAAEAGELVLVHRGEVLAHGADLAAGGAFEPAHEHEERRFARPRRPREPQRLPLSHVERDAVQDVHPPGVAGERQARVPQ